MLALRAVADALHQQRLLQCGTDLLPRVGGASVLGWGIAFRHVTVALLVGALAFVWLRPSDLAGDRSSREPRAVRGTIMPR